jgi:tetratricopeptide (TPR) repeat protein
MALCLTIASVSVARPLAGQLQEAEQAFAQGHYAAARTGYERVLAADSLNLRALYRLAILDGWDSRFDSALARFAKVRRLEPRDLDIMVAHARVLSWAGRMPEALALYDSALARAPDRADALAGRARVIAWSGDLDRAERLWRAALARHQDDAELLLGLAQTLYWKDEPALAAVYTRRARRLAPEDRAARDLERTLRAALRPEVRTAVDGASDSDQNDFVSQEAALTTSLGLDLRALLRAGWRRTTDPSPRRGSSYGGGGVLIAALSPEVEVRAGVGFRRLNPEGGPARTPLTAELGLGLQLARDAALSLSYGRTAFDETAVLINSGFVLDAAELEFALAPSPRWAISGEAGATWVSDTNRNRGLHAAGAVLLRMLPGLQLGPSGHVLGYRVSSFNPNSFNGYFAPNWFAVLEARAVYSWQHRGWGVRADGGLGIQQVERGGAQQAEWHAGLTLSRGWGSNNEASLVGSITNSAAASNASRTTGHYSYRSLGLRLQQGL